MKKENAAEIKNEIVSGSNAEIVPEVNTENILELETGNVLVIGNSGVGKSTLINAVLGEERALASWGTEGTTRELQIYEGNELPFRVIDSVGFEPSFLRERKAIRAVRKWSRESIKKGGNEKKINAIWFCVDGTARKLFPKTIKSLSKATAMWETVPVIVVITKSYSAPEREENIKMVYNAFARQKRYSKNLKGVIPVVASTFTLNDTAYAPPEGITELIELTNSLLPEGIKSSVTDIEKYKLRRKRAFAHSLVAAATAAATVVGAVPIPGTDAAILVPLETAEINSLARIYGLNKNDKGRKFLNSIIEVGTVSAAARTLISILKAIPGINVTAAVLDAVIAGSIVAAIGECSVYAFEQISLGKKSIDDIDWIKKFMESKLASPEVTDKIKKVLKLSEKDKDGKSIGKNIIKVFRNKA